MTIKELENHCKEMIAHPIIKRNINIWDEHRMILSLIEENVKLKEENVKLKKENEKC